MRIRSWARVTEVCKLKEPAFFLFVLGIVSRIYKTRKLLFSSCMYRYVFRFTMNLTTILLQKDWKKNVKWTKGSYTVVMVTIYDLSKLIIYLLLDFLKFC